MPAACNFAFCYHLVSNGISKSKIERFFLSMNLNFRLKSQFMTDMFEKSNDILIKLKDDNVKFQLNEAKMKKIEVFGTDTSRIIRPILILI